MQSIYEKYLGHMATYVPQYGAKTVVLMMVGSFYELYALNNADDPFTQIFQQVVKLCQFNTSEKKKVVHSGFPVLMAGFPEYTLDKYVQILADNGFTSVVIDQDEENSKKGAKKQHMVAGIYSPGTFIPSSSDTKTSNTLSNNIMSIWLHSYKPVNKPKQQLVIAVSILNMFSGKSQLYERMVPHENAATTYDDLERLVSIANPCEVLLISNFPAELVPSYAGIICECIHTYNYENPWIVNCSKRVYQERILENVFGPDALNVCEEYGRYPMATQSFCFLLDFVKEHNPALINKIAQPEFAFTGTQMLLANHALKQLNIIDDKNENHGRLSSICSFVNKACTPMGRRQIKELLCAPIYDEDTLQMSYDMTEALLTSQDIFVTNVRTLLNGIADMEKLMRQIVVKKIMPLGVANMADSLQVCYHVVTQSESVPLLHSVLSRGSTPKLLISEVINNISKWINIELVNNSTETLTIINKGINESLDKLVQEYETTKAHLDAIKGFLDMVMRTTASAEAIDYVKINTTEKSGSSFQITKTRGKLLKSLLDNRGYMTNPCFKNCIKDGKVFNRGFQISLEDIKFKNATTSNDEIVSAQIQQLCHSLFVTEEMIKRADSRIFAEFVADVLEFVMPELQRIVDYITQIDVVCTKAFIARSYKYVKPVIKAEHDCGFVDAHGLRHALIEHIQTNEIYVANDIVLDKGGILLYGTNAVGKTSLIRALGIAVLLAQCGFYVPCSEFIYKPFRALYTRILGTDNLYKGLSTFGVEMSELRMILKNADKWSLILGDELCSGTETQSALSIFVAGLMDLHEKESSFIFATHFHEIVNYDEVKALTRLRLNHMTVFYDRERDCLVYDRQLKEGPGDSMYGLEVCKSLHLPQEFLDQAFRLRTKYFPECGGDLTLTTSRHNAQKIRGLCEICGERIGEEIHHLMMQNSADKDGFIGHVNKNHKANLMSLCEHCHQEMHSVSSLSDGSSEKVDFKQVKKVIKKKTTKGLMAFEK